VAAIIRGGSVVNAFGRCQADLRVESRRVVAIGADVAQPGDEVLDATG
jgi:dihydropyrimidinase